MIPSDDSSHVSYFVGVHNVVNSVNDSHFFLGNFVARK